MRTFECLGDIIDKILNKIDLAKDNLLSVQNIKISHKDQSADQSIAKSECTGQSTDKSDNSIDNDLSVDKQEDTDQSIDKSEDTDHYVDYTIFMEYLDEAKSKIKKYGGLIDLTYLVVR